MSFELPQVATARLSREGALPSREKLRIGARGDAPSPAVERAVLAWNEFRSTLLSLLLLSVCLAGCAERPDPRFQAPLVSGVITLPMTATQRFDERLSANGFVAALRGGENRGITFSTIDATSSGEDGATQGSADIVLAQLPAASFDPRILGPGVAPAAALADEGQTLVLGSGFVSVLDPVAPLGLLQVEGAVLSEITPHGYTRVLGVRDGSERHIAIVGRNDFHQGMFESAIQVGPGIIEGGLLDISPRERKLPTYVRAFVASCSDRWIVGITQVPMHLIDVGERLLGFFAAEEIACDEVVNLSGDREALLAVMSEDRRSITYFGNPTLPRASLLAFAAATH